MLKLIYNIWYDGGEVINEKNKKQKEKDEETLSTLHAKSAWQFDCMELCINKLNLL
ncbi:MAG: hypothetical protein FWD71_07685 [Oscillospiraceae bacterium]|nr:hypothetical protein [Oscillospiraceae bacterium]